MNKRLPKTITRGDLITRILRDCNIKTQNETSLSKLSTDDLIIFYYTYQKEEL